MNHPDEIQVEVFRAGNYGPKGVYTEEDLDAIAADYDPADHEAPVTFDHEQKGPAHGWVTGVRRLGDRLVATLARISPALFQALKAGAFKKRSVELYRQYARTGRPYLKALSFLGAAPPEVKGLQDPAFAEGETATICFEEEPPDYLAQARAALMEKNAWRPEWEKSLGPIFQSLGGTAEFDALVAFLGERGAPAPFGRVSIQSGTTTSTFAEDLVGGASPDSRTRHRAALQFMQANEDTEYRDALLRVGRED